MSKWVVGSLFSLLFAAVGCSAPSAPEPSGHVAEALEAGAGPARGTIVISQIYGGAADPSATFQYDFIELFNRSKAAVTLDGLTLQTANSADNFGTGPNDVIPLTGEVPSGGAFLVAHLSGAGDAGDFPTPDLDTTLVLDQKRGKVAIAPTLSSLGCGAEGGKRCATKDVIDLVGYGTVSDWEGATQAAPIGPTSVAVRKGKGCTDTDNNSADFSVDTAPSNPRSSATTPSPCVTPQPDAAPPVTDPPLGPESPYDGGTYRDAGPVTGSGGSSSGGCASAPFVGANAAMGAVMGALLVLSMRRRRGQRKS